MKRILLPIVLAATSSLCHSAIISGTGYSADGIVDAGTTNTAGDQIADVTDTAAYTELANQGMVEEGFTNPGGSSISGTPIPQNGLITASSGTVFQLAAANVNNVLLDGDIFTFSAPGQYSDLQFLYNGVSGSFTATINFADATTATVVASLDDWQGGGGTATSDGTTVSNAYSQALVRDDLSTRARNAREITFDIVTADEAKTINSIHFAMGGRGVVTAISGTVVPEPSSLALLGLCGIALVLRRRR